MTDTTLLPPDADTEPEAITARSGSNLIAGFVCLDVERRRAMTSIYAFCRVVDDAVDDAPDAVVGRQRLEFWRGELAAAAAGDGRPRSPVGTALQAAMVRFSVPQQPLLDLIDGCAMDLEPNGIADADELHLYCYRVAAAVGLACLHVFGATSDGAQRFANALGQALQHTNILRDLRSDAELGRVYVPRSWLAELELDRDWLLGSGPQHVYRAGGPVARVCDRLVSIASDQFDRASKELRALPRRERRALIAARIMGAVYGDLLRRLRRRGGNLVLPRARVPRPRKLWLALQVFLGLHA